MAEPPAEPVAVDDHDDHEETPGYVPPAEKSLETILQQDQEDESLRKYKETLLGGMSPPDPVFPENPSKVILNKLALVVDGRPEVEQDLSDPEQIAKKTFVIKEGCKYKMKIYFYVQREIVTGLKYVQKSSRKGIKVDKTTYMVGSYGPKTELQSFMTPLEDAPSGILSRGSYKIESCFTDDDKTEHLKWTWNLEIKKDWE